MNNLRKLINRERTVTPPDKLLSTLEQEVMDKITTQQSARKNLVAKSAMVFMAVVVIGLYYLLGPEQSADETRQLQSSQLAVESVVIMSDHTAIWLEPARSKKGKD